MTVHRTNIVVLLFDQLRFDVVHDPRLARTPSLDRLRGEGTWFEQHHTTTGICSPARGSILTGLYPHTHGVLNNVHGRTALVTDLPAHHASLGELLADAGYRTGYVGKWHLGRVQGAADRGWADVRFPEGEDDPALATGLQRHIESMVYARPPGAEGPSFALYLRDPVPPSLVPANRAFDDAIGLLAHYAAHREPFCLMVSFAEPHHPTILSEDFVDLYDPAGIEPWRSFSDTFEGKPRTNEAGLRHYGVGSLTWDDWAPIVARYLATVTMLDELVGRLLAELERLDRRDDTAIVVTADHGDLLGSHRQLNKGPLMYDEVYRVPLLVRAPGPPHAGAGRRVDALTSHVDLLPTLAELAGVALPPRAWPGRSLVPWLDGQDSPAWREELLCEFHGDEFGLYSQRMLRRGAHKLVYNPNDVTELYDLAADPDELNNLAAERDARDLRDDLEAALLEAMRATGDGLADFATTTLA